MATYQIHVVNREFESRNEVEAEDFEAAKMHGLKAALDIGTEEVCKGVSPFFGAQVTIESDGAVKERMVIGIGASSLK